jgi:hypothetical protein
MDLSAHRYKTEGSHTQKRPLEYKLRSSEWLLILNGCTKYFSFTIQHSYENWTFRKRRNLFACRNGCLGSFWFFETLAYPIASLYLTLKASIDSRQAFAVLLLEYVKLLYKCFSQFINSSELWYRYGYCVGRVDRRTNSQGIQGVFKKRPNFCYKDFIVQHLNTVPFKVVPSAGDTPFPAFLPSLNASWNALSVMARSSLIAFSWISAC